MGSIWVEELKDWVDEEDLEIIKELLEENKQLRKLKRKKELLQKYKDKFSNELKAKYGIDQ
jgi:hypothetical protein